MLSSPACLPSPTTVWHPNKLMTWLMKQDLEDQFQDCCIFEFFMKVFSSLGPFLNTFYLLYFSQHYTLYM